MENAVLSILVNGMMAVLLFVTIIYCWRLNNRIRILQDSKSELARIINEFNESTERATQSIKEIHSATDRISENIQHKIDKANFLVTDLDFMIEKGQRLTGNTPAARGEAPRSAPAPATGGRVVDHVRPARSEAALTAAAGNVSRAAPLADDAAARRPANRQRSRAEQDILQALSSKNEGR